MTNWTFKSQQQTLRGPHIEDTYMYLANMALRGTVFTIHSSMDSDSGAFRA